MISTETETKRKRHGEKFVRLQEDFEVLGQCFFTAGPRPGTGPWHQLYRAARGSPGICHFSFLRNFHA